MSSRKTAGRRGTNKKRAQRATSNVFAMFDQAQIAEFKEAFNMIDQNRDGFVDKDDLHDMLASLGKRFNLILIHYYGDASNKNECRKKYINKLILTKNVFVYCCYKI